MRRAYLDVAFVIGTLDNRTVSSRSTRSPQPLFLRHVLKQPLCAWHSGGDLIHGTKKLWMRTSSAKWSTNQSSGKPSSKAHLTLLRIVAQSLNASSCTRATGCQIYSSTVRLPERTSTVAVIPGIKVTALPVSSSTRSPSIATSTK